MHTDTNLANTFTDIKKWVMNNVGYSIAAGSLAGISSGFIYGFRRQSRKAKTEQFVAVKIKDSIKTNYSLWEKLLGLDKKLSPSGAAWRALLGGSILCWGMGGMIIISTGALLGVKSLAEFATKMNAVVPKAKTLNFSDEETLPQDELEDITNIFLQSLKDDVPPKVQ